MKNRCSSPWKIKGSAVFGEGAEGRVYESCAVREHDEQDDQDDQEDCTTLTKVMSIGPYHSQESINRILGQADLQALAATRGISPRVHDAYVCSTPVSSASGLFVEGKAPVDPPWFEQDEPYAFITMNKAPGVPVSKWLLMEHPYEEQEGEVAAAPRERLCTAIGRAAKELNDLHLYHGDLHEDNLFYDEKKDRVTVIDFGGAIPPSRWDEKLASIQLTRALTAGACEGGYASKDEMDEAIDSVEDLVHKVPQSEIEPDIAENFAVVLEEAGESDSEGGDSSSAGSEAD